MAITGNMIDAIANGQPLVLLAEIEHPSGTARFWSGVGALDYNAVTWTGAGKLGTVTPIKHTSQLGVQDIQFTLAGADPDIVATLDDDVRNRSGKVWLACLGEHGEVVPDPLPIVDAQLDFQSEQISDDGTAVISITARTGFYNLERSLNDVWSSEDQQKRFPGDNGLDMISKLQNQALIWAPT